MLLVDEAFRAVLKVSPDRVGFGRQIAAHRRIRMNGTNRYRLIGLPADKAVVGWSGTSSTMPAADMKQAGIAEALPPRSPQTGQSNSSAAQPDFLTRQIPPRTKD